MRGHFTIVLAAAALVAAAGAGAATAPVAVTGFVDAGWAGNLDRRDDAFSLNQVEIDLARRDGDDLALRADLEWVRDGEQWLAAAEQGFMAWRLPFWRPATLTLGKFNAPIGWELLDPPDLNTWSHGLLFAYGTPSNLSGAMLAGNLGAAWDWKAYAVNGWDRNGATGRARTFGGRLGCTRAGLGNLGVSMISGLEDEQAARHTVVDVDLTLTPSAGLLIGGEFNHGRVELGETAATWTGFMLTARVAVGDRVALTGRVDTVDDAHDHLFAVGEPVRRSSFTLAPACTLREGLRALAEIRLDRASRDVFTAHDGTPKDTTVSGALTLTCTF